MNARPLHFNAFIWPNGYHESAWRVVDDDIRGVLGLSYYSDIARIAERGLMDSIFLADNIAIAEYRAAYLPQTQFDPISVLSALAAGTTHIGLIGTGSTTYNQPWELARRFATLDHLSGGRAGWNIVTTVTPLAAANFGEPTHPDHADRYARAHEFVEVVTRVWDSWEDGAVIGDRERGVWADRSKLHAPRFHGQYYDVEGVQPFPRSPQGHPVLVLAGQSGAGVELAARHADMVFSGPPSREAAVAFRADLHAQAAALGRDPERVLVLPALMITLGGTEAEAAKPSTTARRTRQFRVPLAKRPLHSRPRSRRLRPQRSAALSPLGQAITLDSRRSALHRRAGTTGSLFARDRPAGGRWRRTIAFRRYTRAARRLHHRLARRRGRRRVHLDGIDTAL